MNKIYEIAVVGGGAAGIMATLRGVLNNDEVLLFPGDGKDKKRSRAFWVSKVENMPGYHDYKKGIDNPNKSTIEWIEQSHFKDRLTQVKNVGVRSITKRDDFFEITDSNDQKYKAKYVVLCTGIMDVQPHFNNSIKEIFPYANAQTVDYCLRCDGHHVLGKHTSIIGNTSSAAWVAVMLKERYQTPSMSILLNGAKAEFDDDVKELIDLYKIEVFESEIIEVLGDKKTGVLEGYRFKSGRQLQSEFTFVSLGTIVYNELAKEIGAEIDNRGYVVTDSKGMTRVENFYVAGDIRAGFKKQIYTAWDMAVDTVDDINRKIRAERRHILLEKKRNKS
ncbi:NAD(P)/FAD-dependent oxidoreductase [Bacteriovorax sp. Seq25_V]|uniref:NAD(P)/FAD-dependent oxidoreductase n=1 Tax=Bacteriovorax sp. Seq25_V TaxID=1201288 RepID=UPI00038A4D24|nr:NAD(P)/FAD-dependent oxidoreductase [Bacteriovorax sp. Seq25_V]EQC46953.1 pyridine nucleotide-disulfide oxidoreductase [Bacteriovorax sp. Seq25_V]